MDANELMIGDWVRLCDSKAPLQMEDVSGTGMFKKWTSDGEYMIPYSYSEIEPIPLTPEILEKNGFVERVFCEGEYELRCEGYRIIIHLSSGYTHIYKGGYLPILNNRNYKFVHELQHALRLCGIEKEFKI